MDKLCICIRCHDYAESVIDTIDSVKYYSTTNPYIMVAIDLKDENNIAGLISRSHPDVGVYISPRRCGWGKGLYRLFVGALEWGNGEKRFDHYCVIDYDTLFIRQGADAMLLSEIDKGVGLMGAMQHPHDNWVRVINKYWSKITKHITLPEGYEKGRSVLGAMMVLTKEGIRTFRQKGYFKEPYLDVLGTPISDDLWISMLTYSTGLGVKNIGSYTPENTKREPWKKVAITWGHPTPPQVAFDGGAYVYHPAKGQSGGKLMSRDDRQKERAFRAIFKERRAHNGNINRAVVRG